MFCSDYIPYFKPVGVVFAVSPRIKIVHLKQETSNWYEGESYCQKLTEGGGRWYMPDKDELNEIYEKKTQLNESLHKLGNVGLAVHKLEEGWYWSSSSYNSYNAWIQYFSSGGQNYNYKSNQSSVRAVRAY